MKYRRRELKFRLCLVDDRIDPLYLNNSNIFQTFKLLNYYSNEYTVKLYHETTYDTIIICTCVLQLVYI